MATVKLEKKPIMSVDKIALKADRLVYLLVANTSFKYPEKRSHIAYIGTTKRGIGRVAASIAYRWKSLQKKRIRGLKSLRAHALTYHGKRKGIWKKLERGALLAFKREYGRIPILNKQGKGFRRRDEFEYFSEGTLVKKFQPFEKLKNR